MGAVFEYENGWDGYRIKFHLQRDLRTWSSCHQM